jgi:hypothetical protein
MSPDKPQPLGESDFHSYPNRWFPPKVIRIWPELHEFERMGLVLEYFLKSGQYRDLETFSMRGLPRPENDQYFGQIRYADPVFAVWGRKISSKLEA